LRLCLRIKGIVDKSISIYNLFKNGEVTDRAMDWFKHNKKKCCELCNWTCPMMGEVDMTDELIHTDKRG